MQINLLNVTLSLSEEICALPSDVNKTILQDQDVAFQDQNHRSQDQDQDHSQKLPAIMPTKSGTIPFQRDLTKSK